MLSSAAFYIGFITLSKGFYNRSLLRKGNAIITSPVVARPVLRLHLCFISYSGAKLGVGKVVDFAKGLEVAHAQQVYFQIKGLRSGLENTRLPTFIKTNLNLAALGHDN